MSPVAWVWLSGPPPCSSDMLPPNSPEARACRLEKLFRLNCIVLASRCHALSRWAWLRWGHSKCRRLVGRRSAGVTHGNPRPATSAAAARGAAASSPTLLSRLSPAGIGASDGMTRRGPGMLLCVRYPLVQARGCPEACRLVHRPYCLIKALKTCSHSNSNWQLAAIRERHAVTGPAQGAGPPGC